MRAKIWGRPSLGTVLGLMALIVAVVGTASATPTRTIIRKGDLGNGSVTARAIARGAVKSRALAKGAVNEKAVAKSVIGSSALTPNAVTAAALAPSSVYGGALGQTVVRTGAIADLDAVPSNIEWTESNPIVVACSPGERPMSGGVVFTDTGTHEVAITKSGPVENGWVGQITSNAGGAAKAEVQVLCLR